MLITHWENELRIESKKKHLLFEALVEANNVLLFELAEHFHLTHSRFLDNLIVIWLFEFLNRDWTNSKLDTTRS